MANTKISALTSGSPAQLTDLFPISRSGANFSLSVDDILSLSAYRVTVTLTSAQLLSDFAAVPLVVIDAPGPNKVIVPIHISWQMHVGDTYYQNGSDIGFSLGIIDNNGKPLYTPKDIVTPLSASIIDGAAVINASVDRRGFTSITTLSTDMNEPDTTTDGFVNNPLYAYLIGALFTDGDGTIDITTHYAIMPV